MVKVMSLFKQTTEIEPGITVSSPNWKAITIATVAVIVLVLLVVMFKFYYQPSQKPSSISKSVPVTLNVARGNLTSMIGSTITVDVYGNVRSFSIKDTKDFQKVVSGQIKTGDAKTGRASVSELKVGQQILVIADIGSIQARSVYILNQ